MTQDKTPELKACRDAFKAYLKTASRPNSYPDLQREAFEAAWNTRPAEAQEQKGDEQITTAQALNIAQARICELERKLETATPEPQGAEVAEAVATSKLKEAFGMFLNGLAYYETFPDNAEDAAQLRKAATYNFMRAARHINEELSDLCSAAAKAVYVTEHEAATRQQRSEEHRNDLMDKIVAQKTEIGALRAQIESQQDGRVDALVKALEFYAGHKQCISCGFSPETATEALTRQPVETKPVEQEEFIEKTGYVDIYDKIIASGFIITRKD